MLVLPLRLISQVADRIERAYLRYYPYGTSQAAVHESGVWMAAAGLLVHLHREQPEIPLDPELYVAAQAQAVPLADPWRALVQAGALRRYCQCVDQIVELLRRELAAEIRLIEDRVRRGRPLPQVLAWPARKLSPFGRFLAAHRARRPDLAESFRAGCCEQHRGCPLYRLACAAFLAPDLYPVLDLLPGIAWLPPHNSHPAQFSVN